ncbi:natriuretic peptides A [Brachyhypopomus gauderio]|uniref:natriuretic peptides A n=1 Tax=Brachyhypopomus gauderio TaxID=698409 RepID=UPI004041E974
MVRGLILAGLVVLLCHHAAVEAHVLGRQNSVNTVGKLKSLLEQFEEVLAAEDSDARPEYDDGKTVLGQNQGSPAWERDRQEQAPSPEDVGPDEGLEAQRKRLIDLLLSTRSKSFSGCFGGRLDRIGSSSSLGCNSMRG